MNRQRAIARGIAALAAAAPAHAQPPVQLPPIQVESTPSCVDVEVQGSRSLSFDCLNRHLQDTGQGDSAPIPTARGVTGSGAPTTMGTFSYTATAIRMGNAFGKSAVPQRPAPPVFTNALIPHGAR